MKANELMIGDWVSYKGIYNRIAPADFDSNHERWIENIVPIPFTPKILEKNGWKWNEHRTMLNLVVGTIHVGWGFYKDCLSISDHSHDGDCQISSLKCIYVHQLQHTLGLCGIDKTIEL